jgi:iron complex transport system permease protein
MTSLPLPLSGVSGAADREAHARFQLLVLATLLAVAVAAFLVELMLGTVRIPAADVIRALVGGAADREIADIVLRVRLPRGLTAAAAGSALAVCGLVLQTLLRNPLAGPWVLGVVAGARFGVAVLILTVGAVAATISSRVSLGGSLSVAIAAAVGSTAVLALMAAVARRVSTVTLLVLGFLFSFLVGGVTSVMLHFASEEQFAIWESWNDGSFGGVTWSQLTVLLPVVLIGLVAANALAKPLDSLLIGERYARTMGVAVSRVRWFAIALVAGLAGAPTAYCGTLTFVDIAVPHLARGLLRSADHRVLIPGCALLGAALALAADVLSHLPGTNRVMHLNAILSMIGAPVVIWVIYRRHATRVAE